MILDFRRWWIPKNLAVLAILIGIILSLTTPVVRIEDSVIGVLSGFLGLWSVNIVLTTTLRKLSLLEADTFSMGSGDPFLLAVIGGFLGYKILPLIVFLGSLQGLLLFSFAKLSKAPKFFARAPKGYVNAVPFGAFLCLASLELMILSGLMKIPALPYGHWSF